MTPEQSKILVDLVKKEAKAIKENATEKEIDNLDFDELRPANTQRCIYGQMTGDCYSLRANDLIVKCAKRVYETTGGINKCNIHKLNGKPFLLDNSQLRTQKYHSPIELFILFDEKNNKMLIDYLKGNRKTFKIVTPLENISLVY